MAGSKDRDVFGSLTTLSTEALKFAGIINAGGAVVVLANLRELAVTVRSDGLQWAVLLFALGAVLVAVTHALAYVTNLTLLQEENGSAREGAHSKFIRFALITFVMSIASFSAGVVVPLHRLTFAP